MTFRKLAYLIERKTWEAGVLRISSAAPFAGDEAPNKADSISLYVATRKKGVLSNFFRMSSLRNIMHLRISAT